MTDRAWALLAVVDELMPAAFHMQNLRRSHYELGVEARQHRRVATAFTELARTI